MDWKNWVPWKSSDSRVPVRRQQDPFRLFRQEMDSLFNDFWGSPGFQNFPTVSEGAKGFTPSVNVTEGDKEITVRAELPGMKQEDVDISLVDDRLSIKGTKTDKTERKEGEYSYYESSYGSFQRIVPLNGLDIDEDNIDASMKDGVLTIRLPKTESSVRGPKTISIR